MDLMVKDAAAKEELIASTEGRVFDLTDRQACDVEMLVSGG